VASPSPSKQAAQVFSLFGLEPCFEIDQADLEDRLRQASMAWHPDRFALQGEAALAEAEDKMAAFNDAFPQLRDASKRAELLLRWLGAAPTQGTDSEAPPEFLMRMMELREEAEEARAAANGNPEQLAKFLAGIRAHEQALLARFGAAFDDLPSSLRRCEAAQDDAAALPEALKELRRVFYELRYYQRTREQLQEALAIDG
jgi:molecular chaperone HscB